MSQMRIVALLAVALLTACAEVSPAPSPRIIYGLRPEYDLEGLLIQSEVIAVVDVINSRDRINNAFNRPIDRTRDLIFQDSQLEATVTIRGSAPTQVRQTGGKVGDFEMRIDGSQLLESGERYLLFLTDWLWNEDGAIIPAIGITGGNAGIFTWNGSSWVNDVGLTVTAKELAEQVVLHPNDPSAGMPLTPEQLAGRQAFMSPTADPASP